MFPGEGEGEIELDGLGIPTVELRVKHDADEPKTGKKKGKKKRKKIETVDGEPVRRLAWWEEWEEGEDLRVSNFGYSPYVFTCICAFSLFCLTWPLGALDHSVDGKL
jgi:hypothetical protein